MIQMKIADDFAAAGVNVTLGCIQCRVRVSESDDALARALDGEIARQEDRLAETPINQIPTVLATRKAYKALGKDPSRYRPAAEALLRRIKQGKGMYRVNTVVDVNNLVSLGTGFSIGAYTVEALEPPLILRRAGAGDTYDGIGRGPVNLEGLPVFFDESGPFGCPTSDSERTLISVNTKTLLMVLFAFGDQPTLTEAVSLTARLLTEYCGAEDLETAFLAPS
jgi:DNA/RNA-binding domain of Phe-tRNA-synthetase-like protein